MTKHALFLATLLVAGCSGGGHSVVSADWPGKWCQAEPGISKEQLVALMGQPTSSPPSQMVWSDDHWRFYAFLKPDGTVRQLDINQVDLTPAEKAGLQCKDVRGERYMEAKAKAKSPTTDEQTAPPSDARTACEIIPPARMSEIIGSEVTGEQHGQDKCIYTGPGANGPYVEFSFERGNGDAGMAGAGMAGSSQAALTSSLEGIGDKAVAAGPALFIKSGADLITIVTTGAVDRAALAKKIVAATKAGP